MGPSVDLMWALGIGSAVGLVLAVSLVSTILLGQRRHRITQQQKLKAVEERERNYRSLMEQASDGILIADRQGKLLLVNSHACVILGYTRDELMSLNVADILPPEDLRSATFQYDDLVTGKSVLADSRLRKKNGALVEAEISAKVLDDGRLQAIVRDITARKRVEQALQQSEERYRAFITQSSEAIWRFELDQPVRVDLTPEQQIDLIYRHGYLAESNDAMARMYGLSSSEEIVGTRLEKMLVPSNPENIRLLQAFIRSGYRLVDGESREIDVNGRVRWFLNNFIGIIENGTLLRAWGTQREITERKEAEEKLRQNEQRFRALIEKSSDGIVVLNQEGIIGYAGPSTTTLLGYTTEELMGKVVFDLVHPDDRERIIKVFGRLIQEPNEVVATEFQVIRKNGARQWFEGVGRNLLAEPAIRGIVVNYRDVSERKRSDEALRLSEEKYRRFFREDLSGIFISTPEGRLIDCNPRFAEILGYDSIEDVLAANTYSMYEHRSQRDKFLQLLREKKRLTNYEHTLLRRDGRKIRVVSNVSAEFDEQGNLALIRGYLFDVTERQEAEERYRTLFEESKDVIFISTPEGQLLDVNPAAVELFGYSSKEEIMGVDVARDLYLNPSDRERYVKVLRRQGYVKDFQLDLRRKDGQKLVVLETTTAVRDQAGKIVAYRGIMRDMTEQKRLEDQLRQAQKMESIGTLAGGIAHDFNNILAIILAHVGILERGDFSGGRFSPNLVSLQKAVQRGAGLVRQLLTFARKTEVQFESVNVNSAVEDIAGILAETLPKAIAVKLDLEGTLPSIAADHNQLHQVLLNLCVNARDAMMDPSRGRAAGGTLTVRTYTVTGEKLYPRFPEAVAEHYACIEVLDTGIGMNEETKSRIFEPFFTTKGMGKGTGLGLSVAYGVVKGHQGFIDVESDWGKTTTFSMYFPVPQRNPGESIMKTIEKGEPAGGMETILVVEDEEMLLELVKTVLEEKGYNVLTASDGEQAVELYGKNKDAIALVLSDMGLPKMGGWEAFQRMRKINPKVKSILASGYLDPGIRSEMLKAGAIDFVQKPYDVNDILRKIRETIDQPSSND